MVVLADTTDLMYTETTDCPEVTVSSAVHTSVCKQVYQTVSTEQHSTAQHSTAQHTYLHVCQRVVTSYQCTALRLQEVQHNCHENEEEEEEKKKKS